MDTQKFRAARLSLILGLLLIGPALSQSPNPKLLEDQINNALTPPIPPGGLSRGLTIAPPDAKTMEQQQFIDGLRRRSLVIESNKPGEGAGHAGEIVVAPEERDRIADIANQRPKIDLEIYFDYNSWEVRPKAVPTLVALGNVLSRRDFHDTIFLINGYTDARGSAEYNQVLSQRRAESVRRLLAAQFQLPKDILVAVGFGKEHLKFPNRPFADENRRVQIVNTEMKASTIEK